MLKGSEVESAEAFAVSDTPFEQVCLRLRGAPLDLYLDLMLAKHPRQEELKVMALQLKLLNGSQR